jgi:SET domain-containing protein
MTSNGGCRLPSGDPFACSTRFDMSTKRHVPRVNPKFACFRLRVGSSRIERYGVFAQEAIPRGKRVIQYTGERVSQREARRRAARISFARKAGRIYLIYVNRRSTLDGAVGGSGAEFINHSCDPNLTMRRLRGQIFLYSFRRIKAGEELTVDYGFRCCPCCCGSKKCRGTMCRL